MQDCGCSRWRLCISFFLALVFMPCSVCLSSPEKGKVLPSHLNNLLLGAGEVPQSVVLSRLDLSPEDAPLSYEEHWVGKEKTRYSVDIKVTIMPSAAVAMKSLDRLSRSFAAIPRPVTGMKPYSDFSDRAYVWGDNGAVRFMRSNVIAEVCAHGGSGSVSADVLAICRAVAKRIDAAAKGKPISAPALSGLTSDIVWGGRYVVWNAQFSLGNIWKEKKITIALVDLNGIHRLLPAKRIDANGFMVPVTYVSRLLKIYGALHHYKTDPRKALKVNGKLVKLSDGSRNVEIDGRSFALAAPVRIDAGRAWTPLSLIEETTGRKFSWRTGDNGIPVGELR